MGLYKAESGALVLGSNSNNEGDFFQNNVRFVLSKENRGIKTPFKLNTDDVSYSSSFQSPSELGSIYWGSNNTWNREIFDKSGVHIETRKLNYSQLLIDEVRYQTDLSGDGVINNDSIEKIFSSYNTNTPYSNVAGLYKTKSGAIVFDQNNLNINDSLQRPTSSLTKDGKLHSFSVEPSIAMKIDPNGTGQQNEYSAFLKNGGKWSKEVFNSSGELIDTINYNYEPHLLADETTFQIDIDGDGSIGNRSIQSYNESGSKSLYKVEGGNYILANSGSLLGTYPDKQKLLLKDNKPFEFSYKPSASYSYSTQPDPNNPQNEEWVLEVYSGYENNWIKDTFDGDGQFIKSKKSKSNPIIAFRAKCTSRFKR